MTDRRRGDSHGGEYPMPDQALLQIADGGSVLTGVVDAFDEDMGLGSVRHESGSSLDFHCTAIADSTRSIAVGTAVAFTICTGHNGTVEARAMVKLASA